MTIDRNNFEAFFLDYWEGNLSEQERKSITSFLEDNPDLRDQFYDFQEVMDVSLIPDETVFFNHKNNLKKKEELVSFGPINSENYETFVIASLEGDLTRKANEDYQKFIQLNPNIEKVREQYKKAYLKAPKSIIFTDKERLKKKTIFLSKTNIIRWSGAVAAIFIIGFVVFPILRNSKPQVIDNPVAQQILLKADDEKKVTTDDNLSPSEKNKVSGNTKSDHKVSEFTENIDAKNQKTNFSNADLGKDQEIINKSQVVERESVIFNSLPSIARSQPVVINVEASKNINKRNEFSTILDDLFLRDILRNEQDIVKKERSALTKVLANWGNKVINAASSEEVNSSLVMQIANKGKETVTGFSGLLPVYKTTENEGKKETYLAISESFSIYRSKNIEETQPEKTPNKQ